jgi:sulfocyanin
MGKGAKGSPATTPWIVSQSAAAKTVTFKVVAGYNRTANGFNFDGGANGAMTFTVPADWKVTLQFSNQAALPHSAVVTSSRTSVTPAFAGAATPNAATGTAKGQSATVTFTANPAGTYYLVCAVPGHEGLGMWDRFVVSSSATSPSVSG